jgi:hypothetical protein
MAFTECMKSELDLFRPRAIQTNILKTEEISYKPLTSLENQSVIEFMCHGSGETYIDLSSINIAVKIQLLKNDKDAYVNADVVQPGVVNNMLHSLFRQVNLSLNGKSINTSDGNYSYRSYIETLLNFGDDASKTHLEMAGYNLDQKPMDNLGSVAANGYNKRKAMLKNSAIIELYGKVHVDMLNQPLLLLNNVDVRLMFTLNKPEFFIITDADVDTTTFKIVEATLFVKHCTINPNILIAHHKMLERTNAKYYYKRCEVKSFTTPSKGYTSINIDNVVLGQLPTTIIFFMVDNDAYTGSRKKNPYNFKNNKITTCSLYVNGVPIPNTPLTLDFTDTQQEFSRGYATLLSSSGLLHTADGNLITREMYAYGYFMLAYDLTPDLSTNASCTSLANQGNIRLEARFATALTTTITCMAYMEFDSTLEIDKNRNIILDH